MKPEIERGLYLITQDEEDSSRFLANVAQALMGRPALVQYRNKAAPVAQRCDQAAAVLLLCRIAGVPLIINDDIELALEIGADGVHLGRMDGSLPQARARLGAQRLLGASCYNELALGRAAVDAGVDYVAFGAMFSSATKPTAARAPLGVLTQARQLFGGVRIVAIGGISFENARQVIESGADLVAVISDVFASSDPAKKVAAYRALFETA